MRNMTCPACRFRHPQGLTCAQAAEAAKANRPPAVIEGMDVIARLSNRELATVLAALRNWQEITSEEGGNDPHDLSPLFFEDEVPLTTEEIDALCERINQ